MKLAFLEIKEDWEHEEIRKRFPHAEIFEDAITHIEPEKLQEVSVISSFIYSAWDKHTIDSFPNLKCIITRSTGYDHIDMDYCREKGILIYNVPHYGENTVAEFTFALLLAISRRIIDSVTRVKSGSFDFSGLRGFDLHGKTVGVLGFGNIGRRFAKMCIGFEMRVLVYDPFLHEEDAKALGVTAVNLETLYKEADIISLHVPLNEHTRHIINKDSIAQMKNGVVLLNTARGDLIDSTALLEALVSRKVAFAGLDVLEGEQMILDEIELLKEETKKASDMEILLEAHLLIGNRKVLVTPHNAFNTIDALKRILETSLQNIEDFYGEKISPNKLC